MRSIRAHGLDQFVDSIKTGLTEALGCSVIGRTPEDFRALIEDGIARYGAIIKAAGIKPQ